MLLLIAAAGVQWILRPPAEDLLAPLQRYWRNNRPEWSERLQSTWLEWQTRSGEIPEPDENPGSDAAPPPQPRPPSSAPRILMP